jgi:putative endonuclease
VSKEKGKYGEEIACKVLSSFGYEVIETNYLTRYGEIDIIARKGGIIHCIEVKSTYGAYNPAENFHKTKLKRFLKTVRIYCYMNHLTEEQIQVDLALVDLKNRVFNLVEHADAYFD